MKSFLSILVFILCSVTFKKEDLPVSGKYDELNLAFNPSTNMITGFFESYTGYDEVTQRARFSCIFYFEGKVINNAAQIKSYYPRDKEDDMIKGNLKILSKSRVEIQLPEEHGGCWNVYQFTIPAAFSLSESKSWKEIRYVIKDKAYFYSEKTESSQRNAYVVKGDIMYIERVEDQWAYCKYYGKKVTEGWIKLETLNNL